MEAIEDPVFDSIESVMLDAEGNPMGFGRPTDCIHVSSLVKRIRALRSKAGAPEGWQEGTVGYVGFLWENALEEAFRALGLDLGAVEKQVRLQRGKLCGTLDAIDWGQLVPELWESKATYQTQRKVTPTPEEDLKTLLARNFDEWLIQIKAYLYLMREIVPHANTCRLFVLFLRGDYAKDLPAGPRVRAFRLTFTDQEINENWAMLVRMAEEGE
jgi:hypothetical protein